MAIVSIREYDGLATDKNGQLTSFFEKPIAVQNVTATTNSVSATLNARTNFVLITSDADVYYNNGATATPAHVYLPAFLDRPESVDGGDTITAVAK